jgi:hypothetical protein
LDWDDEPIPSARQSLNIFGVLRGITDSFPQYRHRNVNTAFKIDNSVIRPEHLLDLISGHDLAPAVYENSKNLEGLLSKKDRLRRSAANPQSIRDKLASSQVQLEASESHSL